MLFTYNTSFANSDELLKEIERNCRDAKVLREYIEKLKTSASEECKSNFEKSFVVEDAFESDYIKMRESRTSMEFNNYLKMFNSLDINFTKEDLLDVLPRVDDYRFKKIIFRLQAEVVKEMKEIYEFINEEIDNLSLREISDLEESLKLEKRKQEMLKDLMTKDFTCDSSDSLATGNKLILIPSASGNIKFIDEITNMPTEYFQSFKELIDSIADGSFKNFKRFVFNDALTGMCEVKGFKTRVIFSRIGFDAYTLVSAILKKTDNSRGYREHLTKRVSEYRLIEAFLKAKVCDEEFMKKNDFYVKELYSILENKDKSKKYKKI